MTIATMLTPGQRAAVDAYRVSSVETAAPDRIIVMAYDRLTLDIERAIAAMDAGQRGDEPLLHAQALVLELLSALDQEAWSGGPGLAGIYAYLHRQLIAANVKQDSAIARDCLGIVDPLREAWAQASTQLRDQVHEVVEEESIADAPARPSVNESA